MNEPSYKSMGFEQSLGFGRSESEQIVITEKGTNRLALIQGFVEKINEAECLVAFILSKTRFGGLKTQECKPLSNFFKDINKMMDEYNQSLIYSPEVELFFGSGAACGWVYEGEMSPMDLCRDGVTMAEKFNELIVMIKQGLQSKRFKRDVRYREGKQKRNYDSAMKYVDALFACYARLLVIRVDLGYPYDPDLHANTKLDVFQKDMKRFKRRMNIDPIFKDMAGFIFKMEYGLSKGHHLHCMFFFDGSKVMKDKYIAQKIGELWTKITGHRGGFFNCNWVKESYKFLGIGMVNHYESEKRRNLGLALSYLFKAEQFLFYRYKKKARGFFKGDMPKCGGSRQGRPREIPERLDALSL